MPIDPKKISELTELTTLAGADKVPVIDDSAATPAAKNKWMSLDTLKAWIGALANPMTTEGDLIVGGASGVPARLAKGEDGQILKMVSGVLAWVAEATGFSNPMTTAGDIIVGGEAGAPARLAKGANGQVLKIVDDALAWANDETGEGGTGMSNPMTTAGDIIVGGEAGAPARLAKGANGQVLKIVDDALAWADDETGEGTPGESNTVYSERSYAGSPVINGGHFMVAPTAMTLRRLDASVENGGTGIPQVAIYRVAGEVGSVELGNAAASGEGKYGSAEIVGEGATITAGDVLSVIVLNTGEYMSSGAAEGLLIVGLEWERG